MSVGLRSKETVVSLLKGAVAEAPDVAALVTPAERITYRELEARARRMAWSCSVAGVEPGERVAIWLANGADWLVAHWAAALGGCIVVPLSTRLPAAEVVRLLRHAEATALFSGDRFGEIDARAKLREVLEVVAQDLKLVVVRTAGNDRKTAGAVSWEEVLTSASRSDDQEMPCEADLADPDSVHLIQYTSGTTGEPKGAMLAHRGMVRAARAHAAAWNLQPADPILVPNPFSHILGFMYGCLVPSAAAATSLSMPVFEVEAALSLLADERAVALTGAPTHLQMLVEHPKRATFDLKALRLAMTGGAPISSEWGRRVVAGLGVETLVNGYGMSEAGSVAQTRPSDPLEVAVSSVGFPMEGLEVKVVDMESKQRVPIGKTGELWIRGASVMKGYLEAPVLTKAALTADGWLRTGDLASLKEDGRIRYVNRLVEMFTVGGFNVYPSRVEAAIREHPEVEQAAVLPIQDERLGARPRAIVVLARSSRRSATASRTGSASGPPASPALDDQNPVDLDAFCRERLAGYEVPDRFVFLDELPLNPAGKVDRRRLSAELAAAPPVETPATAGVCSAHGVPGEDSSACGFPEPEFGNYFVAAYPPFSQWTAEAIPAFRQALDAAPDEGVAPPGLYCHIPFCVDRCRYCYYLSHSGRQLERVDAYLEGLIEELGVLVQKPALVGRSLDFVYFGGGTPSLLSTSRLERLLTAMNRVWSWSTTREVTFECAPRSVTADKMIALRAAGVTRLSLGVQQLDDEILRRNGRVHLVADVERAFECIQRADFPIVNLDLMVGLEGETEESFWRSLERTVAMRPESVTLYQMEIPRNTPLWKDLQVGGEEPPPASWEEKHDRLERAFAWLDQRGYRAISAYTAVLAPESHGFVYQRAQYHGADLIGIGISSFSYLQGVHQQNETSLTPYLEELDHGRLPLGRAYILSDEERLVRELVLQLKLGRVDPAWFRIKFDVDLLERFAEPLRLFSDLGWLQCASSRIELTPQGIPRADRMLPEFYLAAHREVRYS